MEVQGRDSATSRSNKKIFNWANLILILQGKSGFIVSDLMYMQRDTENDLSRFSLFFSRKFRICKPHLVSFHNRIVE